MKKTGIKIFIILFFLSCTFFSSSEKEKQLHIYVDPATTPALLQMTHFIKQNESDYKIAVWNRYYGHIRNKDQFKNTSFCNTGKFNFNDQTPFFEQIKKLLNIHPNLAIHLHFNLLHNQVYQFLSSHPITKNKIISLHIYEDASGHIWRDQSFNNFFSKLTIKPVFYHWGDSKNFCEENNPFPSCKNVLTLLKKTQPKQINFKKIASTLSEKDKRKIFDLTGFNYEKTKSLLKGKKTHFYILGYDWRKPIGGAQLGTLKSLCQQKSTKLEREREREREREM